MRVTGSRPLTSLAVSVCFTFGMYLPAEQIHFLPRLFSMSLLPFLFGSAHELLRKPRLKPFLLFSLTGAWQVFGGQLEIFGRGQITIWLVMFLFTVLTRPKLAVITNRILVFMAACAILALLASAQLAPSFELLPMSSRSYDLPYKSIVLLNGLWLVRFGLMTSAIWNPLLVPALLLSFFLARKDRLIAALIITIVICLAWAQNLWSVLWLIHKIPVVKKLIWHIYMVNMAMMLSGVLAGRVLDWVTDAGPRSLAFKLLMILAGVSLAVGIFSPFPPPLHPGPADTVRKLILGVVLGYLLLWAVISRREGYYPGKIPTGTLWAALALGSFISGIFALDVRSREPLQYPASYRKHVQKASPLWRTHNITNRKYYDESSIPHQAGVHLDSHSFDFFFQVMPSWSFEFFSLIKPFWYVYDYEKEEWVSLITNPKKIIKPFEMFKHGDFINDRTRNYLNFMNVTIVAADRENFPLAPTHYLSYNLLGPECKPASCKIVSAAGSPTGINYIELPAGSALDFRFHAREGDLLQFTIRGQGMDDSPDQSLEFIVSAESEDKDPEFPLFFLAMTPGQSNGGRKASIDLSLLAGKDITLRTGVTRQGSGNWQEASGIWEDLRITHEGLPYVRVAGGGDLNIYRNMDALPRAYLVNQAIVFPGPRQRLAYLSGDDFNPGKEVVLEESPPLPISVQGAKGTVKFLTYEMDQLELEVVATSPSMLVMSETYYPGWKSFDNGVETRILRANHAFRALALETGIHRIIMLYRPWPLRIGIFASMTSALFLLGIALGRLFPGWSG